MWMRSGVTSTSANLWGKCMDPKFMNVPEEEPGKDERVNEEPVSAEPVEAEPSPEVPEEISSPSPSEKENSEDAGDGSEGQADHALVEVVPGPILSPESLSKDNSVGFPKEVEEPIPFYRDRNFWKNVVVIALAVIVIGAIAGGVGYLAGKGRSGDETTRKTKTTQKDDSTKKTKKGESSDSTETPGSSATGSFSIYGLRAACVSAGMKIMDNKDSTYDFMAYDDSMQVLVTLQEVGQIDFDQLVQNLICDTTNVESDKLTQNGNIVRYDGLQDKEHPDLGYSFLELIYVDGYYVFVQGLAEKESDSVIIRARNLAGSVEEALGIS